MTQPGRFITLEDKVSVDTIHAAGWTVVALHFLLLAANRWILFDQLQAQTPVDLREMLARVLLSEGLRAGAAEVLALTLAGAVALQLRAPAQSLADARRLLGVLLLSYVPIALHSIGVAAAFLSGWHVDVWIASAANATPDQVATTIEEALPIVLEPLARARMLVNLGAAALFALLLRRACGFPTRRSLVAAGAFAAVLSLTYVL